MDEATPYQVFTCYFRKFWKVRIVPKPPGTVHLQPHPKLNSAQFKEHNDRNPKESLYMFILHQLEVIGKSDE